MESTDWAATPLGPRERWPQALRIAVSICLNSRFPMFVWWGPELINIYNDAYAPVLGQRHPQAFGRPARATWSDIWPVLAPQVDEVMQGRPTWNERVLLVMERNGFAEDTWFTWSYSPIYDDNGRIGGLFCACTEETGRVVAERERDDLVRQALDTAQLLQTWFDNAPGFVALLRGPDFVFEMVNQAYHQLVGHRPVQGLPLFEALPDVKDQGFQELLDEVYRTGQPFVGRSIPVRLQRTPGAAKVERFVDLVYQPVRDADGAVVGIFVQGHDVTDQVTTERALQEADRRKDEFLATLAHELRNPLAPIRQAAAVAKRPDSGARRDWAIDVIERQTRHMALLLDDLLDISRISRGRLQLRVEPVVLQELVEAAVETVRPIIDAKQHRLRMELPAQPIRLSGDKLRLAQVLGNLLSNAAKYTDAGGEIRLSATLLDGEAEVRVRDNGIGLSPGSQDHIFEMFSQVSSAMDRAEGGLGIGLALSRGLVHLHGGRIEARSGGIGQGSEFIVTLPTRGATAAQTPTTPDATATAEARPRRVLLADDNVDALETLQMLLQLQGHEVDIARDGHEAVTVAERARPDVVVLDIGMPGLNGYEAAAKIRQAEWGQPMLLVALTGWGQDKDQQRAREAGFDFHFTKPVDPSQLESLITSAQAPR